METAEYLDRTLAKYAGTFDIYKPYTVNGKEYPAYGYFFSCSEKYVLVKKANLWSVHSYEHVLFLEADEFTAELLDEIGHVMKDHMEPHLVRRDEKNPEKDHMYSFITVAVICRKRPADEMIRAVKRFRFEKDYMFTLRGHSEGHLICADMETEGVYTNSPARQMKKVYMQTFDDVRKGKAGYAEAFEKV